MDARAESGAVALDKQQVRSHPDCSDRRVEIQAAATVLPHGEAANQTRGPGVSGVGERAPKEEHDGVEARAASATGKIRSNHARVESMNHSETAGDGQEGRLQT